MFFIIDGFIISIIILLGIIVILIIFDNQTIPDKELLIINKEEKKSVFNSFFRNLADVANYFIPGLFGKILSLLIIITLFQILALFEFTFEARLGYAIPSGLIITSLYLSYRTWLTGQQKKLLYTHWRVVGKKGLYSSGDVPHIGEVILELDRITRISMPAGLATPEKVANSSVVVKEVTTAGSLIVETENAEDMAADGTLAYRHDSIQEVMKNAFSKIKKTFLNFK